MFCEWPLTAVNYLLLADGGSLWITLPPLVLVMPGGGHGHEVGHECKFPFYLGPVVVLNLHISPHSAFKNMLKFWKFSSYSPMRQPLISLALLNVGEFEFLLGKDSLCLGFRPRRCLVTSAL